MIESTLWVHTSAAYTTADEYWTFDSQITQITRTILLSCDLLNACFVLTKFDYHSIPFYKHVPFFVVTSRRNGLELVFIHLPSVLWRSLKSSYCYWDSILRESPTQSLPVTIKSISIARHNCHTTAGHLIEAHIYSIHPVHHIPTNTLQLHTTSFKSQPSYIRVNLWHGWTPSYNAGGSSKWLRGI